MSILPPIKSMKSPIITEFEPTKPERTQVYEPLPTIKKSNSNISLFETPVKPLKQESQSTLRKKRSGWWDNKEQNIDVIKDLIKKSSNVKASSQESLSSIEISTSEKERKSDRRNEIGKPDNLSDIATAAENHKDDVQENPKKPGVKKKERPPWYSEPLPAVDPSESNEKYTVIQSQLELTPTPPAGPRRKHTPRNKPTTATSLPLNKIEKIVESKIEHEVDVISIYQYLLESNMEHAAESFRNEARIPATVSNKLKMEYFIKKKDFGKAVVLVQKVMASVDNPQLLPSFEDLIYVLSKYLLLYLYSIDQIHIADRTLKMVIWPLVQKEQKNGGVRANWFTSDYHLLDNLLSASPNPNNIYKTFDWEKELQKFWDSISLVNNPTLSSPPLFAYALAQHFNTDYSCVSLKQVFADSKKIVKISQILKQEKQQKTLKPEPEEPTYYPPPRKPQADSASSAPSQKLSFSTEMSKKSKFGMDQLPPLSYEQENTSFAISKACGPSPTPFRVMDVKTVGDTGQIIAATAGSDKTIIIWDVGENTILNTLQNNTVKPIVCLNFHPSFDELLVSADMEFDVKLWNWKEGNVIRWWKKHHTRIINQIGYIPGDDTRAISCSGDQSLKIWNIHSDRSNRSGVHANEPISSFVFCGAPSDPLQQKLIVSLSYSLRIYKLRTLQLLHTISLDDIKLTKCPVFHMESHPQFDNYILISSDHQLRLFDLTTEACARLKGHFSPQGTFVYSGTLMDKNGSRIKEQEGEFTGCSIWKVHSGKLEQKDMDAMEDVGKFEFLDKEIGKTEVVGCKWYLVIILGLW
ncbi:protein with putative role during mitosis [Boothiomyces macroporosus]|uniref:Protein with putative role during mitosis n=1 Tax=Boothiomyces macroporosus TaxID=261099 RepID=A0AAD5UCV1_9FUNG|nr:protein with putative role during mitosis [Boothiomyces macroporosus]